MLGHGIFRRWLREVGTKLCFCKTNKFQSIRVHTQIANCAKSDGTFKNAKSGFRVLFFNSLVFCFLFFLLQSHLTSQEIAIIKKKKVCFPEQKREDIF